MVSPLYHPALGGVGRQAVFLSEYLHSVGVKTMVICRRISSMPPWKPVAGIEIIRIKALNNTKHDLEAKSVVNLLISLSFSVNLLRSLIRERNSYDIVHFHGASLPLIINTVPLKLMGKKIVAKVAGAKMNIEAGSFKWKYFGIGNVFIRILKKVDMFIAITDEIRSDLLKDGFDSKKIFKTTNFILPAVFYPVSDINEKKRIQDLLALQPGRKVITFSGRLVQRKRVDLLLQAIARIINCRQDIQVLILGQGELMESLKQLSDNLGLSEYVRFQGFVRNILDYLHATDIFLFTSDIEGMPNSLLEAMACRLPVIATRIGGTVDVLEDNENGIIVPSGDDDELAKAILRLLEDDACCARLADSAIHTIRERFSIDSVASRYVALYRRMIYGG
ncbi:MAG: glycosyltransferase family 4 protein [Nitrospirae bacterium]|nr:glycosyltransferase family 4 protein [Nitrospirota bacterium]